MRIAVSRIHFEQALPRRIMVFCIELRGQACARGRVYAPRCAVGDDEARVAPVIELVEELAWGFGALHAFHREFSHRNVVSAVIHLSDFSCKGIEVEVGLKPIEIPNREAGSDEAPGGGRNIH